MQFQVKSIYSIFKGATFCQKPEGIYELYENGKIIQLLNSTSQVLR